MLFFDAPDDESNTLGEGIHGGILNRLATVEGLTVIARTSVLQYEGTRKPIAEIADELNVENVMEGSVRFANNRVRVTSQLIDAGIGEIDAVLYTHHHVDHILGLDDLRSFNLFTLADYHAKVAPDGYV